MAHKIVVCGAGFLGHFTTIDAYNCSNMSLGSNIARTLAAGNASRQIQISSRHPQKTLDALNNASSQFSAVPLDITKPETLKFAFRDAAVVISLVGIMHGSPSDFERIQWKGAENVAHAAKNAGARLIHFSAIGADEQSSIPYARTKALAERVVFEICPNATIIRPSLVFGPGDDFFTV